MIRIIERTSQFKRDYKRVIKNGCNEEDFLVILKYIVAQESLPPKYRDHKLNDSKEYKNVRECHIYPDWILVYRVIESEQILELIRTGSHSDLF